MEEPFISVDAPPRPAPATAPPAEAPSADAGAQWPGRVPTAAGPATPAAAADRATHAADAGTAIHAGDAGPGTPGVDTGPVGDAADAGAAAVSALASGVDAVCGLDPTALSADRLVATLVGLEEQTRRLPTARHALVAEVAVRDIAGGHGCRSVAVFLRSLLRLGPGEAKAWVSTAEALAPRRSMTSGDPLPAVLPVTAAAQGAGTISAEHVRLIAATIRRIPAALGGEVRADAEKALVAYAGQFDTKKFTRLAERLLDCLDPDGTGERHRDAKRLRGVTIGLPGLDGLSRISGWLTPLVREAFLCVLETLAAPNPLHPDNITTPDDVADDTPGRQRAPDDDGGDRDGHRDATAKRDASADGPRGTHRDASSDGDRADGPRGTRRDASSDADRADGHGTASAPGRAGRKLPAGSQLRDTRSAEQRMHDALGEVCERLLATGTLPRQAGMPATMVLIANLSDLEKRTGLVTTAHGGHIPIDDAVRVAARANLFPAVFDTDGTPLWLGQSRRLAGLGQRLAAIARDRGCTVPGCDIGAWRCQMHHDPPWEPVHPGDPPGTTDIDHLALICSYDHHRIDDWTMHIHQGRAWWTPPPRIDPTRTPRTNTYFKPLQPDATPPPPPPYDTS